jgi:anthranilate/para-aminobenzoate synthase component II
MPEICGANHGLQPACITLDGTLLPLDFLKERLGNNPFMINPSIVILDFGSQYTQLIARRIREQNVYSVVLPCTASLAQIEQANPVGIILSGGPSSVYDTDAPPADARLLALGKPILGICYGLQFITHHLGGKVRSAARREYGHAEVEIVVQTRVPQVSILRPGISEIAAGALKLITDEKKTNRKFQERFRVFESTHPKFCYPLT